MKADDFNKLITEVSTEGKKKADMYDYAGYAIISDLKMNRDELRKAIDIMWAICMEMDKESRDNTYLFGKGLIKSKDVFLTQYQKPDTNIPEDKVKKFREKLENIKPLVEVLIKLKEVL